MQAHFSKLIAYLNSFEQLPVVFVKELEKNLSINYIKKGSLYYHKNSYSKKVGFLSDGVMRIYDVDKSGFEWNKEILTEATLLLGNPNINLKSTHYIAAITDCTVVEFPIGFLKKSFEKFPEIKNIETKMLLHLFEKKSIREYEFLSLTAKERYLQFIEKRGEITNQIPKFQIASFLGITATQLSRIIMSIQNQQM